MYELINTIAPFIIGMVMVILILSIVLFSKEERTFEPRKIKRRKRTTQSNKNTNKKKTINA